MQTFLNAVDNITEKLGHSIRWLTLIAILIGALNAIARKAGHALSMNLSSNLYIELQWYLFSLLFLFGASYALKHNEHVRVDVLFGRLSKRNQHHINFWGHLIFLLPFSALLVYLSFDPVINSWKIMEQSPDPGGLPRYPIKSCLLLAFGWLFIQGLAELVKSFRAMRGGS